MKGGGGGGERGIDLPEMALALASAHVRFERRELEMWDTLRAFALVAQCNVHLLDGFVCWMYCKYKVS